MGAITQFYSLPGVSKGHSTLWFSYPLNETPIYAFHKPAACRTPRRTRYIGSGGLRRPRFYSSSDHLSIVVERDLAAVAHPEIEYRVLVDAIGPALGTRPPFVLGRLASVLGHAPSHGRLAYQTTPPGESEA